MLRLPGVQQAMQHVNNLIVIVFLSSSEGKAALVFLSSVLYKKSR